ncbi:MAG: hypothetical protein O3A25_12205 [Acidobacteria bacterium]|nr:hypothetical protein [Acidobacteriota bacterium]
MAIARRGFILSAATLGVAGLAGLRWSATTQRRVALDQVVAQLRDVAGIIDLGTEYLTRVPDEGDDATLGQLLSSGAGGGLRGPDAGELVRTLDTQINADFGSGRVLLFGGWMLSQTELRLCALASLRSRSDDQGLSGVFLPAVLPDGEAVRWTTPSPTLAITADRGIIVLPIRNPAPFERTVSLHLDGRLADEVLVTAESDWWPLKYNLRLLATTRQLLELRITPPWRPPYDFRTVGIGLGHIP